MQAMLAAIIFTSSISSDLSSKTLYCLCYYKDNKSLIIPSHVAVHLLPSHLILIPLFHPHMSRTPSKFFSPSVEPHVIPEPPASDDVDAYLKCGFLHVSFTKSVCI